MRLDDVDDEDDVEDDGDGNDDHVHGNSDGELSAEDARNINPSKALACHIDRDARLFERIQVLYDTICA